MNYLVSLLSLVLYRCCGKEDFMKEFGIHRFERITIDYAETGRRLRKIRMEKELKIPYVAQHVGKSTQLIYDWENGSSSIRLDDFIRICGLYEIAPGKVMCKKKEIGTYSDYDE